MATSNIPTPKTLNINDKSAAVLWKAWRKTWNRFEIATGIDEASDKKRVCTLLSVIGDDAVKVYDAFQYSAGENEDKLDDVLRKFEEHCNPRQNIIFERYKFQCRNQEAGESGAQYMTELRHAADNCDFGGITTNQIIRDRFVHGLRDPKVRERLLREKDLTLERSYEMVQAAEATAVQTHTMAGDQAVCTVQAPNRFRGRIQVHKDEIKAERDGSMACKYCPYDHGPRSCPAYGKECRKCGKKNHFQSKCHNKNIKLVHTSASDDEYSVGTLRVNSVGNKRRAMITLGLGNDGVPVSFQIDSGADCCVLPRDEYVRVTGDKSLVNLRPIKLVIVTYTGAREKALGQCKLLVTRKGVTHRIVFNILQGGYTPILSLSTSEGMGLLKIQDCDSLGSVYSVCATTTGLSANDVLTEYEDVFKGLGRLKDTYTIQIDESVRPVVHAPRRVPVPVREQLREKLDELVNDAVIAPVTEATDWVSSMVVVQKTNGKIRLCLDPKDLNTAIRREQYPIPTIEEVSTRMKQARFFTVMDAKNGFWQIALDEKSSMLTCFNTPFGRYRWLRMPFGINSAPEIWQRSMNQLVEGLEGIEVIHDDFLIVGCGTTDEQAEADHDQNLRAFLDRARERNLRLNPDKMKLKLTEVSYIGHILTRDGLRVDPNKVEAIVKMPAPKDVNAVQRLLGTVNYLAKFVPHLSSILEPLRHLMNKDNEWSWLHIHEEAFNQMKNALTTTPVLQYYDLKKPVCIQCDASDSGLGAGLLQDGLPVVYASRALTATERNYAQIEKELLAIVFACERFDQYVYGREKVSVQSDHKPLEAIFKKPLVTAPKRLQRMMLRLQRYSLDVNYTRGSEMHIADTLSRAYIPGEPSVHAISIAKTDMTTGLSVSPKRLKELQAATADDGVLQKLIQVTVNGWPSQKSNTDLDLRAYYSVRHELTVQDGLLFKDCRIVVPIRLRKDIISSIHRSHQGIQGCIRIAKDTVYWPLMNQQIADYVSQCSICNTHRPDQCKEPMLPHDVPGRPWAKVGADLFELRGQHYLVLVDYYSNFFELMRLTSSTRAKCVIDAMRSQFARHGSPELLMSDNGPQFSCSEFQEFTRKWDIEHVTSSPRYAQSNGQVERAVGTVKSLVKKAIDDGGDIQLALLSFRNTIREGYSASPAQLLFGRRCRTLLPIQRKMLKPKLAVNVSRDRAANQKVQCAQYNRTAHCLAPIALGSAVRMKLPGDATWTLGECTKKLSHRSYAVLVNGYVYRRNRRALRVVNESLPPLPESEPLTSSTDLSDLPREASCTTRHDRSSGPEESPRREESSPLVESPSCGDASHREDVESVPATTARASPTQMRREPRTRRPPAYLADYQQ